MISKNDSVMVVPGYYESKRKERAAGSMHRGKPTLSKQGGAHGVNTSETQLQKLNAMQPVGSVTNIIGDYGNATPIRKDTLLQEEHFNAKIMEIDQELLRYETGEGGNQGAKIDKENMSKPITKKIEVVS